jgi:mRNA interferase MazF
VVLIVSRNEFIGSGYSTVAVVPGYSASTGVNTEVLVGPENGLTHQSFLRCDEITSVQKSRLTDFVGTATTAQLAELEIALALALDIG